MGPVVLCLIEICGIIASRVSGVVYYFIQSMQTLLKLFHMSDIPSTCYGTKDMCWILVERIANTFMARDSTLCIHTYVPLMDV